MINHNMVSGYIIEEVLQTNQTYHYNDMVFINQVKSNVMNEIEWSIV